MFAKKAVARQGLIKLVPCPPRFAGGQAELPTKLGAKKSPLRILGYNVSGQGLLTRCLLTRRQCSFVFEDA